ncbi:MAG: GTP-binding protein [Lachnospiraceae bacterium]|nr:GTP-binding protein [Lachnospiraceae bacterium]
MTKIDIISGFLGAGKTTLIKKLIKESFSGQKVVLIENEFGEIGIDGGFLKEAGIEITEMNSGCICCSLVGDFKTALKKVIEEYKPDRIVIEPSGVGKLSDVAKAVERVNEDEEAVVINSMVTVVDGKKAKMYMKNFGEFFNNQIESAGTVIVSRSQDMSQEKLDDAMALIREHNKEAVIITTPWDEIKGDQILEAMEKGHTLVDSLIEEMKKLPDEEEHHHHHHHHHDHDHDHEEEHHHDHDHEEEHHHDHDHEEGHHHDHDHEEEHHHDHDHEEGHHHHDHDHEEGHHHHHHGHHHHEGELDADDVFQSWGTETAHKYEKSELETILKKLADEESREFGIILRAKGMVPDQSGQWHEFDLTPGEYEIRESSADYTGRLCVIGSDLNEAKVMELFGVK